MIKTAVRAGALAGLGVIVASVLVAAASGSVAWWQAAIVLGAVATRVVVGVVRRASQTR